jgi:hypothetical protein
MIHHLLNHLCSYLEDNIEDCSFYVGYLPGRDAAAQNVDDGVYITLLAITEDVAAKIPFVYAQDVNRKISKQDPPIILELSVMVSAYFKTYTESLKAISKVIQKLADKKKFITDDFSYSLAMYNMTMDQSNNLWQALSTNVLPNVIYKIRHVNVLPDFDENAEITTEVVELTVNTQRK